MGNQANLQGTDRVLKAAAFSSIPKSEYTVAGGFHRINSGASTHFDIPTGASSGVHSYIFKGGVNTVDMQAETENATLEVIARADITGTSGEEEVRKNVSGSSWNSAFKSVLGLDPREQDFAVSWAVEAVNSGIREMGGLTDNPGNAASYKDIDWAIYQVNNKFYSRFYESGSSILIPEYKNIPLVIGDRLGIRVEGGTVTAFLLNSTGIVDMYTSNRKADVPLFFKGAMYRGTGLVTNSLIGDVNWHTAQRVVMRTVGITGNAAAPVNSDDRARLRSTLGMVIEEGSTYGDIYFRRETLDKYTLNGSFMDIEMTHSYHSVHSQDIKVLREGDE